MHAAATLTLTSQFLDRAHALDAAQWQRVARRATGLHIARILETILADWSLEDRVRAVGPPTPPLRPPSGQLGGPSAAQC